MSLDFHCNYAESVMDTIDRSLMVCRDRLPQGNAGLIIWVGRVEFLALRAWHDSHNGNVITEVTSGRGMTLFGYPLKYDNKYESLIQIKGRI